MKMTKLLLAASALACTISVASAADAPQAPQATTQLTITAEDLQTFSASLNLAAATCATNPDGCVIGLRKAAIMAKLQAGFEVLQKQTAPAKK